MALLHETSSQACADERHMRVAILSPDGRVGRRTGSANRAAATIPSHGAKPGELVAGKGIFIGEFEIVNGHSEIVGTRTRWYDAALEFGKPMVFEKAVEAISCNNANGRGGLRIDSARYEATLLARLESGEALGKHVIAPLAVVKEIFKLRDNGEYQRLRNEKLPGKLILTARRPYNSHRQWSCTPHPIYPYLMQTVEFANGLEGLDYNRSRRLSVRACFAELVP